MLKSKVTFISVSEGEFTDDKGQVIKYQRLNLEFENGDLVKDIRFDKGACEGLKKYETVNGYFRIDANKKNSIVFTGYTR